MEANQCNPLIRDLQYYLMERFIILKKLKKLIENNSYKNKINFKGTQILKF